MTRPERMRAAEIREPGRPPVVADREPPVPGDGEVLVDVLAAPITPLDLLCATGTSYFGRPATPYVPGVQGVGIAGGRTVWFPCPAGMAPGDGSMAGPRPCRRRRSSRCRTGPTPRRWPRSGCRPSPPTWR